MRDDYWLMGRTLSTKPAGGKSSENKCLCALNKTVYGLVLSIRQKGLYWISLCSRYAHTNTQSDGSMRAEGEGAEMVDRKQVNVDRLSPRILSQDFSHLFCAKPDRTSRNGTEVRLKVKMWHFLRITNFSPFTSRWFKRCVRPKRTEWKQNRPEEKKKRKKKQFPAEMATPQIQVTPRHYVQVLQPQCV